MIKRIDESSVKGHLHNLNDSNIIGPVSSRKYLYYATRFFIDFYDTEGMILLYENIMISRVTGVNVNTNIFDHNNTCGKYQAQWLPICLSNHHKSAIDNQFRVFDNQLK